MYTAKRQKIMPLRALIQPCLFMFAVGSFAIQSAQAQPGPSPLISTWTAGGDGSGTGNWNMGTNWSAGTVPNVANEDSAIINGGGTAQVGSAIATNPGSVVLGQGTAAGEAGTLEIQSGGSLTVVADPSFPADGSVRVGQSAGQGLDATLSAANPNDGTGTLRVLPGGTLTSVSLLVRGTVDSSITLGGAGAGMATVNTGPLTIGRTMRVIGDNVNFTSSGADARISFQANGILIPEITGATHSPLKTTGPAALGGTLQADFTGVVPAVNQSWDIIDAASVTNMFATVLPDPDVPLGTAQRIATRTVPGGNGQLVQMFVQQMAVLNVNRDTGEVTISNPGTTGVPLDGYTVQSTQGGLSVADWQSLEDNPGVAGTNWFEGGDPSANRLTEVRSAGNATLAGSGSWSIGNIFQPQPPAFGQNTDDIVFQYADPDSKSTVDGIVNYTGVGLINNLQLLVDPSDGTVQISNPSPFDVEIEGYTITSASSSLNSNPTMWTSLQDQPGVAPNWFEGNLTDDRVSEVMSTGTTALTGNSVTTFDLAGLFKNGGTQDLVFEFLLAGESQPNTGVVSYLAGAEFIDGDFDGSNAVGTGDLNLVLDNWGGNVPPVPNGWVGKQPPAGSIGVALLNEVLDNWGDTAGSGAVLAAATVPEPTGLVLLGLALVAVAGLNRRQVH